MIEVIAIGKIKYTEVKKMAEHYRKMCLKWIDVKEREIQKENLGKVLLEKGFTILLDENGKQFNSIDFAKFIENSLSRYSKIRFFIADEEGFSEKDKKKADFIFSLSPLTFPHDIVRVLLYEQIFRAFSILNNHPYHR
jgi:23S rRNA (pseudouridine1915-N3)-methyltransferase